MYWVCVVWEGGVVGWVYSVPLVLGGGGYGVGEGLEARMWSVEGRSGVRILVLVGSGCYVTQGGGLCDV